MRKAIPWVIIGVVLFVFKDVIMAKIKSLFPRYAGSSTDDTTGS